MKRLFYLGLLGSAAAGSLTYLYLNSESSLADQHQQTLMQIARAKEVNASMDKDVLKARNFLLPSYDPIVQGENELTKNCADLRTSLEALNEGRALSRAVADYCDEVGRKLTRIETFKSRNAILRNSFFFLHKGATESAHGRFAVKSERLNRSALAYFLLSNDEAKASLERDISQSLAAGLDQDGDFSLVLSHSHKLLEEKARVDALVIEITSPTLPAVINSLSQVYFQGFEIANKRADFYRGLLFVTCIVFLGLVIFGVMRIWRKSQELADANTNLEQRVEARTRELNQSQQALAVSAKMSALGEMAGGIAHEINNPLASIKTIAGQMGEMLVEAPLDTDLLAEMSAKIEKTTDRIAKIVQGLRTFSRDGSKDSFHPVNVKQLIDDTTSLCRERFKNHQVQLIVENIRPELSFEGRETEISQVLLNLLNNAQDAIAPDPEKWIRISASGGNGWVEIQVTDSGSGIHPDIRGKIFQPFFTTKEIGKGTGLGLSISIGIVNSHKGELTVDSSHPNTRFLLRLRKHIEPKSSAAAA